MQKAVLKGTFAKKKHVMEIAEKRKGGLQKSVGNVQNQFFLMWKKTLEERGGQPGSHR